MQGRGRKRTTSPRRATGVRGLKSPSAHQHGFLFPAAPKTREWIHSKLMFETQPTHGETSRIQALVDHAQAGQAWYTPERVREKGKGAERTVWNVDIDVSHEYRRKGIATQLIHQLIEAAKKNNSAQGKHVNALRIYVDNGDRVAMGFLQKMGFRYKSSNQPTGYGEKSVMIYEYLL